MPTKLSLAFVAAALTLGGPTEAKAPTTTVTRSTGYDFFASWDKQQLCANGAQSSGTEASLTFNEASKVANLSLDFVTCDGSFFAASGETDASQLPFAFDFRQRVAIDKTIGSDGLIAWATYSASIPLFNATLGCYAVANIDIRLDQQAPAQHLSSLTRTNLDGTLSIAFSDFISRVARGTGTIHLTAPPAGITGCNLTGLPSNFAVGSQVTSPYDGSPLTFISKSVSATITRVRSR